MKRRNLVVVRAGENSLHHQWLTLPPEQRNWDLLVSWYGAKEYSRRSDERVFSVVGGKWDGLFATFSAMPSLALDYDYVWLPDDDIETDGETINRLFETMQRENLSAAQPALSWDSHYYHPHTVRWRGFKLRYTNMIETMVPCLSRDTFRKVLPLFSHSMTCWGLDWVWCRADSNNHKRSAILDDVIVRHTRPVGKFLAQRAVAQGENPMEKRDQLLNRFGLVQKKLVPIIYEAVTNKGLMLGETASRIYALGVYAWLVLTGISPAYNAVRPVPKLLTLGRAQLSQLKDTQKTVKLWLEVGQPANGDDGDSADENTHRKNGTG